MEGNYKIITVSELADMVESKNINESVDFTFDTTLENGEPSGWFGVKIVSLFNEPKGCLAIGYYGGGATIVRCINSENNIKELLEEMLWELSETDDSVEHICVDISSSNCIPIYQ